MMPSDFFKYQAQTSPHPLAIEISHAKGSYIYDTNNKAYLDFVAGISACPLGHNHPKVVNAIKSQLDQYMHVMVYGEYIQKPAVKLTKFLAKHLPNPLEKTYLTNSGTEAIEGALKLAKRATGRSEIIAANKAYHGNTMGAMSVMGFEERKQAFRPLLPNVRFIDFNNRAHLKHITTKTACVILETIQGGAGFIEPKINYLENVRNRCKEVGALLILDEIQPGIGRTGKLFGFQQYKCIPDILVTGKGLGGGMPIGAFTASSELMDLLQDNPKLGHITTFGGHPVSAAASLATLSVIQEEKLLEQVATKEQLIRELLVHPKIKRINGKGFMLAAEMESFEVLKPVIDNAIQLGVITDWYLYCDNSMRVAPPLTITEAEIRTACALILEALS